MTELRFLLLEDSLLDAELIQMNLSESGLDCTLMRVGTRTEFVAALVTDRFDLILSDYSLPTFDGFSALEIARSTCPDVPFIFVTATLGEEVAIETLKRGATDYVVKQRLDRLAACVSRALQETKDRAARQRAEAELYRREQEFRALVENSPDIIARFDRSLRNLYVNPAVTQVTGHPPEYFIGKTNGELGFPSELVNVWDESLRRVFAAGKRDLQEFEFPSPSGTRYFQASLVPEFDREGTVQSVLVISHDLTTSKQAEHALRASEAQLRQQADALEQANRLKDEFLAVLSHELRSPLNAILGWSKLLRTRQYDAATTARALETIERNATLQTQLIEDLLDVSRIIRGKLLLNTAPVSLVSVIEAAIETMRLAAIAKNIDVELIANPTIGLVSGDASRLQQIVWNLLSNAIKFTPAGGRVKIHLNQVELEAGSGFAEITVADTGKGISQEFLPHVFESFRQSDASITRAHGGLGLGLAIVRHLVELHGGTVHADSPGVGQGATFVVRLPLLRAIDTTHKPLSSAVSHSRLSDSGWLIEAQPPAAMPLQGLQILIVDDETDTREFVTFVLQEAGAAVTAVPSASQALSAIRQGRPDVLVSDIGMPGADGYMLLRTIRSLEPKWGQPIAAIALTAYARDEDRHQALAAGFQLHLPKPVDPARLTAAVARLTERLQPLSRGRKMRDE
jgi:PAS domain S-box-containing protein